MFKPPSTGCHCPAAGYICSSGVVAGEIDLVMKKVPTSEPVESYTLPDPSYCDPIVTEETPPSELLFKVAGFANN